MKYLNAILTISGVCLQLGVSQTVYGESHDDIKVNIDEEDEVRFEQHFQELYVPSIATSEMVKGFSLAIVGGVIVGGGSTLAFETAAIKAREKLRELKDKDSIDAQRLLKKAKQNMRLSKFAYAGALYLIADGFTGTVIAMNGNKPVYFANLPVLAAYLSREAPEVLEKASQLNGDSLTKPVQEEFDQLMRSLKGEH